MNIISGEKSKNLEVAKKFKETVFWMPENADLFSSDFTLDLPYAPPGWLQHMNHSETITHFEWLAATVKNWKWTEGTLYGTNYPDIFWILREGEGDLFWAKKEGHFSSRFLTRLTVKNGKVTHINDHFDNFLLYQALGIELPLFDYDGPPASDYPEWGPVPDLTKDQEKLAVHAKGVVDTFVDVEFANVNFGDDDCPIYAQNFVHELPFTPENMPRRYEGREYDALNAWLGEHTKTWIVHEGTVLYTTDVEGEYIIESGGHGHMTWSHSGGHTYENRHVSWLRMVDGYAVDYYEYFNMVGKFNSIGVSIPTIPYLY